VKEHIGRYRWTIVALLFFATTINYIDRQVLGILAPVLQKDLGWNEQEFGDIVSWFTIAYAIGFLFVGRIMDRVGTKRGFAGAVVIWSIAAMSSALAKTNAGFSAARFALGLGESGNFPASIKTVSEWFPTRERAFATGIFNAGSNVGAIITPIIVPWIALNWGWEAAFIATGALGFVWLIFWLVIYRPPAEHPKVSPAELAHIQSDPVEPAFPIKWRQLLGYRQTWAFALGKFMTDPIWWFYLYWLPKFLDTRYGITLGKMAAPLIVIYLLADVGSIFGGWLSGFFIKRGWSVNRGRKTAMLIAALLILPTMFAPAATNSGSPF
jgi:MFS transporter, ACS family, hexuronate transporter